jgi:phenylalanyl-tRNA synthetase beta chain
MKISRRWLQRHVDLTGIDSKQILADLTMSTAEIEGLIRFGAGLEPFVIGHVRKRDKHPDADKLSVCEVDLGKAGGVVQIVCGAPNVAAGQRVVVIRPGDTLPESGGKGALKIKIGKIRGVESHGMICSESELGLSQEHDGILVLPPETPIGERLIDVTAVQDDVFEIDNKSINHRPDLWGHYGFARELAAIYGRPLLPMLADLPLPTAGKKVDVAIDDKPGCPRYCGLVIDGVATGPSPNELRWQLAAVGQRAINLPVDLTNYVMLDLGQPMHAFDARHVGTGPIRVRKARANESLTTLDGQVRKLNDQDLLICAGDKPEALAGIMGGAGTRGGHDGRSRHDVAVPRIGELPRLDHPSHQHAARPAHRRQRALREGPGSGQRGTRGAPLPAPAATALPDREGGRPDGRPIRLPLRAEDDHAAARAPAAQARRAAR